MTYYAAVRAFVVIVTTRSCLTESPNLNGRALLHSGPTGVDSRRGRESTPQPSTLVIAKGTGPGSVG